MVVGVALLVVLVVLAVLFVLIPLLRADAPDEQWKTPSPQQVRLVELRERRDAALLALRELELDHETGKLDEHDYAIANAELRAEARAALAALDDDIGATAPEPAVERAAEQPDGA